MKALASITVIVAFIAALRLVEDTPVPVPYEPTSDSAARVRAFVHGDMSTVDEADLYAPSVSPQLRQAAINLR